MTTSPEQDNRDYRFVLGLIAGAVVGAGLGMLFAPRAAVELRGRLASSAKSLGESASERYQQASARVGTAAKDLTTKGQAIRDGVADTVVRGAQSVERFAKAAKADHNHKAPEPSVP